MQADLVAFFPVASHTEVHIVGRLFFATKKGFEMHRYYYPLFGNAAQVCISRSDFLFENIAVSK